MEKGSERMPDIKLTELNAISPLDGRYWKDVKEISGFSSEGALIRTRVEVEAKYMVAL
jgi:adenylosuccinate lyase